MSDPKIIHAQSGGQIAEAVAQPENPRAFPSAAIDDRFGGMTLRDHFAGQVCAAMVSTIRNDEDYLRACMVARDNGFDGLSEWFASDAYKQADAMLAERAKGGAA